MTKSVRSVESGVPLFMWTDGVEVESAAMEQLTNIASLPFIHHHVAVMPDVHLGKGATVGSVIPTVGAIIPAAVGVDIGCGMCAVRTSLTSNDLPDSLSGLRSHLESAIPHGRTDNGGRNDRGAWRDVPGAIDDRWVSISTTYERLVEKHPGVASRNTVNHLGTMGTGNHFVELCLDEDDRVWIMLHSGSRGPGNRIGTYFIERAKREMERWFITLPDSDLAYLPEGSELYDDYVAGVSWAQKFARVNRSIMLDAAIGVMSTRFRDFSCTEEAVECHHNYVSRERHYGSDVLLTRKGAVSAREGQLGIIPGSMGVGSYIVRGRGNHESFCSCSHGAGRRMSRTEARRRITLEQHVADTDGVECRKDESVLDESPAAYKSLDAVMAAQSDLIEVVHRLTPILNVKG
jgi:tRNA-splicing ligase RtcB